MFRQLLTLLVVLFFVQTLVSANHQDSNKVTAQQAIHEESSDDVENFDVAEEDVEEDEEVEEEQEEEEKEEEEEDFDEEFEEFDEVEEAAQDDEDFYEDEENYVDVINRNLASLEELKKALDPLPKKKEELIEGINRNLAKLAATITASNYPTLNPIPTAPSKSRTPSFQPGSTPSNTPTHQVAATPSNTPTHQVAATPSQTKTPQGIPRSLSNTQTMANGINSTVSLSPTTGASISNSVSRASNSPQACRQLSTKKCNQNAACYYSVLYNRCQHKGASSGSTITRSRSRPSAQ